MPHNEPTTDNIWISNISYPDQSALITPIFLEFIALIYEHATQPRMWHTNDVLLDIGSLKKSQLKLCSLSTPRHSRRTAAGSSSLIELAESRMFFRL